MNYSIGSWAVRNRALEDADGAVSNVPAIGRHGSLRAIVRFAGGFFGGWRCIAGRAGFIATEEIEGKKQNECGIMFHASSGDSCGPNVDLLTDRLVHLYFSLWEGKASYR